MISLIPTYWCFSLERAELWRLNVVIKIYEDNHCDEKIRKEKRLSRKDRGVIMVPIEAAVAAVIMYNVQEELSLSSRFPGPLSPHVMLRLLSSGVISCDNPHQIKYSVDCFSQS